VEKYGRDGQASYGNVILRMRIACCLSLPTHNHNMHTYRFSTEIKVTRTCLNVALCKSSVVFCFSILTKADDGRYECTVHPTTVHEGLRYSSTVSLISALDGVGSQCHAPATLPPGKTWYLFV
jgi:hypothetical protein